MIVDLIEDPPFSPNRRDVLTCGSTRVTQKLDPHSLFDPVVWLLADDSERRWAEAMCFFPLTTTSGIAIGVSEVGVRIGCEVSVGMGGRSERTDIICGWQGGGSRRRSGDG